MGKRKKKKKKLRNRKRKPIELRNFFAKDAFIRQKSGGGIHKDKRLKRKTKKDWKKDWDLTDL